MATQRSTPSCIFLPFPCLQAMARGGTQCSVSIYGPNSHGSNSPRGEQRLWGWIFSKLFFCVQRIRIYGCTLNRPVTTKLTGSDQKAGGTYVSFAWTGHSIELYCPGRILFCPETPPQELEAYLPTTTKIRIASPRIFFRWADSLVLRVRYSKLAGS